MLPLLHSVVLIILYHTMHHMLQHVIELGDKYAEGTEVSTQRNPDRP